MRKILLASLLLWTDATVHAKPMTGSVESWEGTFTLKQDNISVNIKGRPKLLLWLYQLEKGSKGTCIGFSTAGGDMMLSPKPNEKGTQPVYAGHIVLFGENGIAEIIVTYDVQGDGGQKVVEKYTYDGKVIKLQSQSHYFGKRQPIWGPAAPLPPIDGVALVKELGPKDSIVLLRIDSRKPAKVVIYRCTIATTVNGPALPAEVTMSFLRFPDCRQMEIGIRYLCVVRQNSGDDYELVRSDMLGGAAKNTMYNWFWPAESDEAKKVIADADTNR